MVVREYKMRVDLTVRRLLDCPVAEGKRSRDRLPPQACSGRTPPIARALERRVAAR
jgi:hypothetical protein